MPALKFKLKKYNMGGYLKFDDGGSTSADELFDQDPIVQQARRGKQTSSQISSMASNVASAIPGVGTAISGVLQIGDAIGKSTTDKYGIYKSKGAQVLDNIVDPTKKIQQISNLASNWDWGGALNVATLGLFGTDQEQEKLKKEKYQNENKAIVNQYAVNEKAGAEARDKIGGFRAAPYGRKGLKLRSMTKFSTCGCNH